MLAQYEQWRLTGVTLRLVSGSKPPCLNQGNTMKRSILMAAALAALGLTACDKPTVVNVPPPPAGAPGPAGPTGATGSQGNEGSQGNTGNTGKPGEGTTVIVVPPPASAPSN